MHYYRSIHLSTLYDLTKSNSVKAVVSKFLKCDRVILKLHGLIIHWSKKKYIFDFGGGDVKYTFTHNKVIYDVNIK